MDCSSAMEYSIATKEKPKVDLECGPAQLSLFSFKLTFLFEEVDFLTQFLKLNQCLQTLHLSYKLHADQVMTLQNPSGNSIFKKRKNDF